MAGLGDFIQGVNKGFWAGNLGAPVDLATLAINGLIAGGGYAGHKLGLLSTPPDLIEKPVGGSEWIADKMRVTGLLSDALGSPADSYGQVAGGLLGPVVAAKSPQIARGLLQAVDNLATPTQLNKQAGVIKTFAGRIPETEKEINKFAEYFIKRAKALGMRTETGASNVSGSRYVSFLGPDSDFQVRISNHGDRYPNSFTTGTRFSIDPESGNTFEMAKDWLRDNGFNLSQHAPKTADIKRLWAGTLASELQALRTARGGAPLTASDVRNLGLVDDLGLLGQ